VVITLLLSGALVNMMLSAVLLLWVNGSDGLFTYCMAKKGYMLDHKREGGGFPAGPENPFEAQTGIITESA
jgi:hypothetical protein